MKASALTIFGRNKLSILYRNYVLVVKSSMLIVILQAKCGQYTQLLHLITKNNFIYGHPNPQVAYLILSYM
jgi:hypothetical protein